MNKIAALIVSIVIVLLLAITTVTFTGHNDDQNWQIIQSTSGAIEIRDTAGFYNKGMSTVYTYPRAFAFKWGPVDVTFNDGGIATLTGTLRVRAPTKEPNRRLMHREFSGDESMKNAEAAMVAHLTNVLKNTGPVMSGSENQSARKGEFYAITYAQLEHGLYQSKKVERQLMDQTDKTGQPITVFATEIILDAATGKPLIQEPSPLTQYGFEIAQFSIEGTEYDPKTKELFAAKKQSFLQAEQSKAQREQEVQERLMIVERGLKQKADAEATANVEKAKLVIEAERKVEVAAQESKQADEIRKKAVTDAQRERDIAALQLEGNKLKAEGIKVTAAAEEERIHKAGAITEEKKILAEIERDTRIGVARELAQVAVPTTMIIGGGGSSSDTMSNLINMFLLQRTGVLAPVK